MVKKPELNKNPNPKVNKLVLNRNLNHLRRVLLKERKPKNQKVNPNHLRKVPLKERKPANLNPNHLKKVPLKEKNPKNPNPNHLKNPVNPEVNLVKNLKERNLK